MNFIPVEDYQGLLKQAKAMHRIIEAMEKSKSIQGKAVDDLTRQLLACGKDHLESEREANQMLTDQVLKLEEDNSRLRGMLWSGNYNDKQRMAEHDAEVIESFLENQLRSACLSSGWNTDSSAYQVSLMLEDYANQLRQKAQEISDDTN